jgi:acetylornithine deacetylase
MSITPAVLETVSRLVAFDSTSRRSNLHIIDYLKDRLTSLGAECRLTHNDDGNKANLYATLGPTDRPGIMLSGHTDVVPTEGQAWSSDPYQLVERDGALYGRGSADMKSFLALAVALAPEFLARGLQVPLHFAFSYDEEIGCIGVRRLIADLEDLPVKPRLCIVGEPTGMKVVAGHKGKRNFSCLVHGKECHSALVAEGVNAVEGGRALNIVPDQCRFEFEIRALPQDDVDLLTETITSYARLTLEPEMKAVHREAGFDFTILNDTEGFDLPDEDEAVKLVTELTGDNRTGRVSFGTEAGLFNRAGIPTVVCGPGYIDQAHKPDEFISLDQLAQGEAFIRRLMARMCLD